MTESTERNEPVQAIEDDDELMKAETEEQRREIMKSRSGKPQEELMEPGEGTDG
jgi:hypothetical protein